MQHLFKHSNPLMTDARIYDGVSCFAGGLAQKVFKIDKM